ncbi:MAG: response regulator [Ignavibacteria bacterium]|nr:response regulator [Ignavibacteria bacterium]
MAKILVIEDDPFNIEIFDLILKRIGNFETVITDNGNEIFKILESEPIDLIVLDVSLENTYLKDEKIDGIVLSKLIKKNPKTKNIPIIIVTAYATKEDVSKIIKESKADECITKPIIDNREFIELIKRHLPNGQ